MAIVCHCPEKCEIHPKYDKPTGVIPPEAFIRQTPEIPAEDKLTLKTLEAAWLQSRIDEETNRRQIETFGAALYEKLGISPQEWDLDIKKLTFNRKG